MQIVQTFGSRELLTSKIAVAYATSAPPRQSHYIHLIFMYCNILIIHQKFQYKKKLACLYLSRVVYECQYYFLFIAIPVFCFQIQNMVAVLLCSVQLALFAIYPSKPNSSNKKAKAKKIN